MQFVKSYTFFLIFGCLFVGVAFLLLFSTNLYWTDLDTGERQLISFSTAGWLACTRSCTAQAARLLYTAMPSHRPPLSVAAVPLTMPIVCTPSPQPLMLAAMPVIRTL